MSEWIRIQERLPEENQRVIVWSEYWSRQPFTAYRKYGYWWGECILNGPDGITHWQPLPAPPTEAQ